VPIDARLMEMLRCPACHGEVRLLDGETGIECAACGRVYPVRDGVPVMLVEEASPPTREEPGGGAGSPAAQRPDSS
jgi:uncharacterized protein YbaR (Trm112 family)